MTTPAVSIVMPVFNGERYLARAVDSILNQTVADFEFVVVNDGSTDGTAAILADYARRDPRLRVEHQLNEGLVAALNRGCAIARSPFIARMDADDIAVPDRLARQLSAFEKDPDLCVVGGAFEVIDPDDRRIEILQFPTSHDEVRSNLLKGFSLICHPTAMLRKEALLAIGGYRKAIVDAEDYDLWLRMSEKGRVGNLPEIVLRYRRHPDQVSVRNLRRQKISHLAAQAASRWRMEGKADPLDGVEEITATTLETLGVPKDAQRQFFLRSYLSCIEGMYNIGNDAAARAALEELQNLPEWKDAESYFVADRHVLVARLLWRESNYIGSVSTFADALRVRPHILARPLKPLMRAITKGKATKGEAASSF